MCRIETYAKILSLLNRSLKNYFNLYSYLKLASIVFCASFFVFGFGAKASAATYYVSPSGSNTAPYDTWAKAANLPSTVITTGNSIAGPHTVYIAPGTYTDALILTNANMSGANIIGTQSSNTTIPAAKGQVVIFSTSGNHTLYAAQSNVVAKNLTLTGTDATHYALYLNGATNFNADNLYAYDAGGSLAYIQSSVGFNIKDSYFKGSGGSEGVSLYGTSAGTFAYNIFSHSANKKLCTWGTYGDGIKQGGSGIVNFLNNIIEGADGIDYINSSTGTSNLSNNIIISGPRPAQKLISRTNGTVNLTNNILVGNWWSSHDLLSGIMATDTGNIKTASPLWQNGARSGYIIPSVDDASNINYALSIESLLSYREMKGLFNQEASLMSSNSSILNPMINRGVMEVGVHGYTHSDLSLTGSIFTISGGTVTINRATDTITYSGGGLLNGFRELTMGQIKTALEGFGATVTPISNYNTGNAGGINATALGEVFDNATASSSMPLLIDTSGISGYWYSEITKAKQIAETSLSGYTAKTFASPFGVQPTGMATAVKNAGFVSERPIVSNTDRSYDLTSINAYNIPYMEINQFLLGANDAATVANTKMLCEAVSNYGLAFSILSHNSSQVTLSQFALVLDTIAQYKNIKVTSMSGLMQELHSAPWSTSDNITYTRSWSDDSDFSLQSTSPAINAGTDVGLTSDFLGNPKSGLSWDIGAYEFQDSTAPTTNANINAGTYNSAQSVMLTCDDGAGVGCDKTYYTLDNSTPTTSSNVYSSAINISATTTLKYFSQDKNQNSESIQTKTYTIDTQAPTGGAFTINSGAAQTNSTNAILNITCPTDPWTPVQMAFGNAAAPINWTSCVSSQAQTLTAGDGSKTVYVRFKDAGNNTTSDLTQTINLDQTSPATTASVNSGTYNSAQSVILTCDDSSGVGCDKTYYTLDNSTPNTSSSQYSTSINIPTTTTLKFFSKDLAGNSESVQTKTYTIDTNIPVTTIDTKPNVLTNSNSASFTFTSNKAGSTFECKLDLGDYATCSSPKNYSNLTDASHTFSVRATDSLSHIELTPPTYTWTIDTVPLTLSNGLPNSVLPAGTVSAQVSINTSKNAICKYDTNSGINFNSMTIFEATGNQMHSFTVQNLINGGSYGFFVKCQDQVGSTSSETLISFSIDTPPVITPIVIPTTNNDNHESKKNNPTSPRKIETSQKVVKNGETLTQRGHKFSKSSIVKVYLSKYGGGYFTPLNVKTSKTGSFIFKTKITGKHKGTYYWYVVDAKSGKKSRIVSYRVK